jgi:hypothetical protein
MKDERAGSGKSFYQTLTVASHYEVGFNDSVRNGSLMAFTKRSQMN